MAMETVNFVTIERGPSRKLNVGAEIRAYVSKAIIVSPSEIHQILQAFEVGPPIKKSFPGGIWKVVMHGNNVFYTDDAGKNILG